MIIDYRQLDDTRARRLIDRLGNWLLVNGDLVKGIFRYPTEEQVLAREGNPSKGKSLRALIRFPEVFLHRADGTFLPNAPLRVLCHPESPDFTLSEFSYESGAMYRITLTECKTAVADTEGRAWR